MAKNSTGNTTGPVWSFTTAAASAALPSPWTHQDVGSTGLAGSASYANGAFNVAGAGADIWGSADAFHYVSQTTSGDVQLVARVSALQNTSQWAKAGIMLRQSLTANSAHVLLDVTPGGIEFMTRTASGATTDFITSGTAAAPNLVEAGPKWQHCHRVDFGQRQHMDHAGQHDDRNSCVGLHRSRCHEPRCQHTEHVDVRQRDADGRNDNSAARGTRNTIVAVAGKRRDRCERAPDAHVVRFGRDDV